MKSLSVLALLALAGCSSSVPTAPVGREFTIAAGQTTEITGTGLVMTFVRVASDSRCPMGALCIQAGNAQVELRATMNGVPATLTLNTTSDPKDAVVAPYHITLTGLTPVPRIANPVDPKDYRATLVIALMPD